MSTLSNVLTGFVFVYFSSSIVIQGIQQGTDVIELSCSLLSIYFDCSNKLDIEDEQLKEYNQLCYRLSTATKFIKKRCTNKTLDKVISYFEESKIPRLNSSMSNERIGWKNLKTDPLNIVNFVVSVVLNDYVYDRSKRRLRYALRYMNHFNGKCRNCDKLRSGNLLRKSEGKVEDKILLEISCTVFTIAKDCSHQYDECSDTCETLTTICNELSFGRQLLTLSCSKETLSNIIRLASVETTSAITTEEQFWQQLMGDNSKMFVINLVKNLYNNNENQWKNLLQYTNSSCSLRFNISIISSIISVTISITSYVSAVG